jgi:hypothetical protein
MSLKFAGLVSIRGAEKGAWLGKIHLCISLRLRAFAVKKSFTPQPGKLFVTGLDEDDCKPTTYSYSPFFFSLGFFFNGNSNPKRVLTTSP